MSNVTLAQFEAVKEFASGQYVFVNEVLTNVKIISTQEEVSLTGANVCNTIAESAVKKGANLPSYRKGYTYLQAIVEAIDWAYVNQDKFPSYKGGVVLADGHSGDYALMKNNSILYCISGKGCWLAANFEPKGN